MALTTVDSAAEEFAVSKFSLYRKIKAGEIPAYKFGRSVRVDLAEVREAMRAQGAVVA